MNIVKKEMPNEAHEKNVVARISEDNQFLVEYIKPWTKFRFREVKREIE